MQSSIVLTTRLGTTTGTSFETLFQAQKLDALGHEWTIIRTPEEWQGLLDQLGVKNLVRLA